MDAVRLTAVRKVFTEGESRRNVLSDVSLTVGSGGLCALLGRSGSGKSTLLNLIAGIDRPTSGTIEVGGVDIGKLSDRERTLVRRRHVGFVFQFFNLLPTLTVEENILLPLDLLGRGRDTRAKADARRLLEAVGLGDRARAFPDRLSGGEQQRVAVARALVHGPSLVLADEPTGALDDETGRAVLSLFVTLARDEGKAVILVSHSADVARAADRVYRLDGGHLHVQTPSQDDA